MFETNPACTACPLHLQARTVCVPTIRWHLGGEDALVVLGQNPGAEEDKAGIPFIGPAGKLLKEVYLTPLLQAGVNPTIYLTNPVRCGPVSPVSELALRTCYPLHTVPDLRRVVEEHRRVALLGTGAPAVFAATGHKLGSHWKLADSFSRQGYALTEDITAFWTYHPAYILRKKVMVHAVADHLELVKNFFLAKTPTISEPHIVRPRPPCPSGTTPTSTTR